MRLSETRHTPPGNNFSGLCSPYQKGRTKPRLVGWDRSRRDVSVEASLGVGTLLLVEKTSLEIRPT